MAELPYGLVPVDQVLAHTQYRAEHRDTVDVERAADLGLHWEDPGASSAKGGFFATVPVRNADGSVQMKKLRLNDQAVTTATRMIKASPGFFAQAEDPDAFPKTFQHLMDSAKRKQHGMLVRHNGLEVTSVLPREYKVRDAYDLLRDFIPAVQENIGQILGVLGIEQHDAAMYSYRIVCQNNIMPSVAPGHGQFLMFNITGSEAGLTDTRTGLGLYRTYCTNSAIQTQTLAKWDHRSSFEAFWDKSASTVRRAGYLSDSWGRIFNELLGSKLPFPAVDLIAAFKSERMISGDHAEVCEVHALSEPSETQYDLFNILTRAAQDLPSIASRELAEANAMKIFTHQGGMIEALRHAEQLKAMRRAGKGPLVQMEGETPTNL